MNSLAKNLIKIALVFGLIYFLLQKGMISIHDTQKALSDWQDLGPAYATIFALFFVGCLRWHWLLEGQGIQMKWWRVVELSFVGGFFNIALPGAVSGDFVKAFYVGRDIPGQRARAFASILFDRVAGVSALVLVSAGAFLFGKAGAMDRLFKPVEFTIILAAICVVCFYSYLFLVKEHHDPVLIACRKIEIKFPKASSITRIYEGLRQYHNHRWTVMKSLILSVGVHMTMAWVTLCFARALGVDSVPYLSFCVLVPLGLLVTAIPVLPAGVGTGHAAFAALFNLVGTQRGADIFTFLALGSIFMGALGGLVYLRFKSHEPVPLVLSETETARS